MATLHRATILTFDPATWTALVLIDGADAEAQIPVSQWLPPAVLLPNVEAAIVLFDPTNPDDGLLFGVYGAVGNWTLPNLNLGGALAIAATAADPFTITVDGSPAGITLTTFRPNISQTRITARSARGSQATPGQSLSGDILFGITANGYDAVTTAFGAAGPFLRYVAAENWTNLAQGTTLQFFATPVGGVANAIAASLTTTVLGLASGSVYQIGGVSVVGTRKTGWTAPTATPSRTAVATGDTLAQTISHLAALVADLTAHGLIGP